MTAAMSLRNNELFPSGRQFRVLQPIAFLNRLIYSNIEQYVCVCLLCNFRIFNNRSLSFKIHIQNVLLCTVMWLMFIHVLIFLVR